MSPEKGRPSDEQPEKYNQPYCYDAGVQLKDGHFGSQRGTYDPDLPEEAPGEKIYVSYVANVRRFKIANEACFE